MCVVARLACSRPKGISGRALHHMSAPWTALLLDDAKVIHGDHAESTTRAVLIFEDLSVASRPRGCAGERASYSRRELRSRNCFIRVVDENDHEIYRTPLDPILNWSVRSSRSDRADRPGARRAVDPLQRSKKFVIPAIVPNRPMPEASAPAGEYRGQAIAPRKLISPSTSSDGEAEIPPREAHTLFGAGCGQPEPLTSVGVVLPNGGRRQDSLEFRNRIQHSSNEA